MLSSMELHPPMPASLRRAAPWPAWPRRVGSAASTDRASGTTVRFDWPLLLFWIGYLAIVGAGVWLFLR
jgi:hypothetical protein